MDQEARPRTAADVLGFADQRDIDDFLDGLAKFESGEWTPDQFKVYRLGRGCYGQRQADVNMIRVKVPLGVLSAQQLERLADVSETYSRGFGHVTTRQNFQFHFCKLGEIGNAMRDLAEVGLTTKEACGNTVRNVTGCAMAGVCRGELFDVTPYGHAVARHFLRRAENAALPRKFKIAFSGCPHDCAMGAINDVACIARVKDGVRGFQVKVAGGLSTTPEDAHLLYEFLPADELIPVIEAVVAVFDKHGNRQNKSRARMKYVVRKLGWDGYRAEVERELAHIQETVCGKRPIDDSEAEPLSRPPSTTGAVVPPAPPIGQSPTGPPHRALPLVAAMGSPSGVSAWRRTNVVPQKQQGYNAVTVRLLRGDLTAAQFRGVARLSRAFADGLARTTIDQNLLLRFVADEAVEPLYQGLVELGLAEADAGTIVDVTSCPGAESCNLAVTASRELASALSTRLSAPNGSAEAVAAAKDLHLKISGCPNSCGQHHVAGIGFHGSMRRVGGRVVPEYTLHLGGGVDDKGAVFGRTFAKVPARRTPDALIKLLELYLAERTPGEDALSFFRRVPEETVKGALAALSRIDETNATAEDFLDLGDDKEFAVATGPGECAT